jgi:calreticulin
LGKFALSSGTFQADKETAQGLQTTEDHRFYSISTPFASVADNSKEDLIVQYTVKQEVNQECGGSYLKLLPEGFDAAKFDGDSEYAIMFGPDVCGPDNRVHIIFNYNGKNLLSKKQYPVPKDSKTHLYRLTVHPDQKFSLLVDGDVLEDHIAIEKNWDVYAPRTIPNPEETKPADWVDVQQIDDPTYVKPANYDQIPRYIPDPEATQPEDWDTEADGDWEAPDIQNPEFKEFIPRFIPNPAYKGEWKASEIPNPEFKEDANLAHYKIGGAGLDLWQVKSGSIFDDIIVTSDAAVADKYLESWKANFKTEGELVEALDAQLKEKEAADAAAAAAAAAAETEKKDEEEKDELDEEEETPVATEAEAEVEVKETETETAPEAEVEVKETETETAPEAEAEAEAVPEAIVEEVKETKEPAPAVVTEVVEEVKEAEAEAEAVVEETKEEKPKVAEKKAEKEEEKKEAAAEAKHDEL